MKARVSRHRSARVALRLISKTNWTSQTTPPKPCIGESKLSSQSRPFLMPWNTPALLRLVDKIRMLDVPQLGPIEEVIESMIDAKERS